MSYRVLVRGIVAAWAARPAAMAEQAPGQGAGGDALAAGRALHDRAAIHEAEPGSSPGAERISYSSDPGRGRGNACQGALQAGAGSHGHHAEQHPGGSRHRNPVPAPQPHAAHHRGGTRSRTGIVRFAGACLAVRLHRHGPGIRRPSSVHQELGRKAVLTGASDAGSLGRMTPGTAVSPGVAWLGCSSSSALGGNRTPYPWLRRPVLCPVSYGRMRRAAPRVERGVFRGLAPRGPPGGGTWCRPRRAEATALQAAERAGAHFRQAPPWFLRPVPQALRALVPGPFPA
jgi:hypothetical protein